jgi:DNA primase
VSGPFDDTLLREVRERTSIVSVIGDYVSLKKAGNSYKGLCPFHNERTPSFTVHEDRQFFYCFGCQTGGDAIRFLQELNGYSFFEAVKSLADRAGIAIPDPPPRGSGAARPGPTKRKVSRSEKDACYAMGKAAQRFFADTLKSTEGFHAAEYLRGRGIHEESVARFGLGFAPDRWDAIETFFKNQNENLELGQKLGLLAQRKSGQGYYDKFRNRVMFPIRSVGGEVIAFSGRDLSGDSEAAKYINSPETPVYTKGDNLFGLHEARQAMRQAGRAVLVEGNLDMVRLSQEGLQETVAPLGTALTETQGRLLKRFVNLAILLYDGDKAGRAATLKAIETCIRIGLQARVVALPTEDDPDTFVGREGIDAMRRLIDESTPAWTYLVDHVIEETDARRDPSGPIRAIDKLAPVLHGIEDRRERLLYERNIAEALDLDAQTVQNFLRQSQRKEFKTQRKVDEGTQQASVSRHGPITVRELQLLVLMLASPDSCALYSAHDVGSNLQDAVIRNVADTLVRAWEETPDIDVASFVSTVEDPELRHALFATLSTRPADGEWKETFEQLELGLKLDALSREVKELKRQLRAAAQRGDDAEVNRLGSQAVTIDKEIEHLRTTRGTRWQN